MSPSHWIWLYCTFSSLKHTKFPSLNKKNPFSLPKSKIYSHQQQFIKRSIKTEQSWVQLIGAALCSSPSFSHGHLGKSIAHLWSKSKKGGEQECKHVVTQSINCFYCAMASASRAVTCGGLGGPDRVTEEIYATLSIKVQLRWTRAMWRRCESVCFMWRRHETAHSHFLKAAGVVHLCRRFPLLALPSVMVLWGGSVAPSSSLTSECFFKTLSSFCGSLESKDSNMNKTGNKQTLRGEPRPPADKPLHIAAPPC